MKKNTIKLNEAQLRDIIKESIKKVLKENSNFDKDIEEIKSIISRLHTLYEESNKRYEELPSALINAQEGSYLSYDTKLLGEAIDILVKYLKHNGAEYTFHQTVYENNKKVPKESIKKVLKEEYLGEKSDMQSLVEVLRLAKQNNMTDYEVFIKGFKFLVHWDSNRQWFEGTMMYSPKSPSTNHIYAETINGFIQRVEQAVNNAMVYYKDGGEY